MTTQCRRKRYGSKEGSKYEILIFISDAFSFTSHHHPPHICNFIGMYEEEEEIKMLSCR